MILAILQARMSSTRLPGKVLLPLAGTPMLSRQIERIQRSRLIDKLIIATSDRPEDDPVAELWPDSFRGSLNDVLDRYYRAALPYSPSHVVRLTGDCPLADWEVIDDCIHFANGYDYVSNTVRPTFPDGLDVEVFTFDALQKAWFEASEPYDLEHVTPYMRRHFKTGSLETCPNLSHLRWTVDTPEDFAFASRVYETLYPTDPAFTTQRILNSGFSGSQCSGKEPVSTAARISGKTSS
jgi:spore coat polysaccharide biosynthesis protein SpsF